MNANFESELLLLQRRFLERAARDAKSLEHCSTQLMSNGPGSDTHQQLARIAHSLAGAAGTFGYPEVSEHAALLDRLLSSGAASAQLAEACGTLARVLMGIVVREFPDPLHLYPTVGATALSQLDPPTPTAGRDELPQARTVVVLEDDEGFPSLASSIASFGFAVARADPGASLIAPVGTVAMVISDKVQDWPKIARLVSQTVPVLLITSDMCFHNRLAAARVGVSGVIPRPCDVFELADWLDEVAKRADEPVFNILIIEDDTLLAASYALELQRAGMHARIAHEASRALEELAANPPDLVLLDFQLPGVNGLDLARIIRQSRRELWLPIVFISAERNPILQLEARKHGGDDFVTKPVDPRELVSLVRLRAERAAALRSLMDKDSLTGLLNHARFKDRLADELERCRRTGIELTLAIIDVDRFKQVNDSYGHQEGDRVLRTLSHTLTAGLRRIDVVGRYGGEEFGIILLDTGAAAAQSVVNRIRQRFSETGFGAGEKEFNVTFSAGLASSRSFETAAGLLSAADKALYAAKDAGRNRVMLAGSAAQARVG